MARTANATYPMKIACLIWLAAESGNPFICAECGKPILPGQAVQFDHRQAVSRGGANDPEALRPVHSAARGTVDTAGNPLDCHDRKTFRPRGGATTLGGDNFEAKKTDRLACMTAEDHQYRMKIESRPASCWPSRPFQQFKRAKSWPSRPMQSRKGNWSKGRYERAQ